jgi:hypothetical protein
LLRERKSNAFKRQDQTNRCDWVHFALASRDPDPDLAHNFSVARLHLKPLKHLQCRSKRSELVYPRFRIAGDLSLEPFDDEKARAAGRVRAYSQSHAGRTRFCSGMAELHLVFFLNRQRPRLPDPLGPEGFASAGTIGFCTG